MMSETSEPTVFENANESCAKAPLNPRWTLKLGVIALIVFAVGVWGYLDASVIYPKRGEKYADWANRSWRRAPNQSIVRSPVDVTERLRGTYLYLLGPSALLLTRHYPYSRLSVGKSSTRVPWALHQY